MSLSKRLFFLSTLVAVSLTFVAALSAQEETDPIPLMASGATVSTGLSIIYDRESGRVSASAPLSTDLTALQLLSENSLFTEECVGVDGAFDVCNPDEVFKLVVDGFATVDFGPILTPNLAGETLLMDLKVNGASLGGGFDVGDGPFLVHSDFLIPEPTTGIIFGCGLCFLVASLRGRMRS